MATSVHYADGRFICRTTFAERHLPKEAGFRFSSEERLWYTPFHSVAARLRAYADSETLKRLDEILITVTPWSKPLRIPKGLELKPFQPDAVKFALERNKSYVALDPGLGKTIVAAVACATLRNYSIVYICPPFLLLNTAEEFRKWAPELGVYVVTSKTDLKYLPYHDVMIFPDSIITRPEVKRVIEAYASTSVSTMLIVDEAHRFKSKDAQRTQALYGKNLGTFTTRSGLVSLFDKVLLMSGTPMPNRPLELYHMLTKVAPETIDFISEFDFGMKYCAGFRSPHGWDFSGASNVEELARRVIFPGGPFMYRLKKDKLDLPPKTEELLIVGRDMSPKLAELSKEILRKHSPEDLIKSEIALAAGLEHEGQLHLATYRRLLGLEKVPFTVDYVKDLLDSGDESVIIFALHRETIARLTKELYTYEPITITGSVPNAMRHKLVKEFQTSKTRRVFIGNIQAAGVGITLTKASRVLMHEFDWTPGNNDQATDRAHRIGQTKNVLVQYLVHRGSVDKAVIETILKKRESTKHI